MKSKIIFLALAIFLITFTSAQLGYNNPKLPRISSPTTISSSSSSSGGNVTSISSGDNCIFVSPTTGDVQITFNTSCGGSGSGDGSFNITYQTFAYNQTTPALNYVRTYYYNKTEIDSFNASWISTFNITYQTWAYNQTTAVFNTILLNNTIAQYGNLIGFNSTYNATYAQFAYNQTRAINPFDQDLNTTSNVVFNNLTVNGQSYFSKLGTFDVDLSDPALKWVRFTGFGGTAEAANLNFGLGAFVFQAANNFNLYFGNDDLSALLSILDTGYIELGGTGVFMRDATARWFETNLSRTTIYNNLSLPNNLDDYWDGDCPSGNYTYGINNNGSLKCSSPLNPIRNIYKSENISTNVTGLTFNTLYTIPLESNTNYTIDCYIRRSSNATTSGIRYNMSLAGTPDWMTVTQTGYTTTTATIQNNIAGATRSLMPTAIATSIAYPTFSLDTINIFIDGNSATSGNAVFQFSGELANLRAVVGRGSYCKPEVVI